MGQSEKLRRKLPVKLYFLETQSRYAEEIARCQSIAVELNFRHF